MKFLGVLLAVCMLAGLIPAGSIGALAAESQKSGTCGKNVSWALSDDGTLTISGTGDMYGEADGNTAYTFPDLSGVKNVIVSEGVTSVGSDAFYRSGGNATIQSVSIASTVTRIEMNAFNRCSAISSVEIKGTGVDIGINAFWGCTSLAALPAGMGEIQDRAFLGCSSLKSLALEEGVTYIGESVFAGCVSATKVTLPASLNGLQFSAFDNCPKLASISVAEGNSFLTSSDNILTSKITNGYSLVLVDRTKTGAVIVPENMTEIFENAFSECAGVTKVYVPKTVTRIGDSTTEDGYLGHTVNGCLNLKDVYYEGTAAQWLLVTDEDAYFKNAAIHYNSTPCDALGAHTWGDGVVTTAPTANADGVMTYTCSVCGNTKTESIPKLSTKRPCGDNATWSLNAEGALTISGTGAMYDESDTYAFSYDPYKSQIKSVTIGGGVTSVGKGAFRDCPALASISVAGTEVSIGESAFENCPLLTALPSGMGIIGKRAFANCAGFTALAVPEGTTRLGDQAFAGCVNAESVSIPSTLNSYYGSIIDSCPKMSTFQVISSHDMGITPGDGMVLCKVTRPSMEVTYTLYLVNRATTGAFIIPDNVSVISPQALSGCAGVTKVFVPKTMETIQNSAYTSSFSSYLPVLPGCENLTDVYYEGTEEEWAAITDNDPYFKKATVHYNSAKCDALGGHAWDEGVVTKEPTADTDGEKTYTCSVCGEKKTEVLPKLSEVVKGSLSITRAGDILTATLVVTEGNSNVSKVEIPTWSELDDQDDIEWPTFSKSEDGIYTARIKISNHRNDACLYNVHCYAITTGGKTVFITKDTFDVTASTDGAQHIEYRTHVENVGWQNYSADGAMAGTSGKSLRLEGINIKIENGAYTGGIEYMTHIQDIGWENAWSADGAMSGTSGKCLRLEAIKIRLTGEMAENYDIYYRVHAENIGWMGWAKNGEIAGTSGYSYRLEAIQIELVEKGGTPADKGITSVTDKAYARPLVSYNVHCENIGWMENVTDGAMAGTSGRCLRLEAIHIKLKNQEFEGSVEYRTHIENIGWEDAYSSDGAMSGTSGQSLRLEAIQIRLTGEMVENYDVYYRVHAENIGWMGWAKNDERAGTAHYSYRLEAIQIQLVPKGESAPSNEGADTDTPFMDRLGNIG